MTESMEKTIKQEYSLWLMPDGPAQQAMADIIRKLSAEYSAPLFPPHITLLGELTLPEEELIDGARRVASLLRPYPVQFGQVEYLDLYFRALFVHIKETSPVMRAGAVARQVFGRENGTYLPHLSLLYGNFTPEVKESIIGKIGKSLDYEFEAKSIFVYSTYGPTATWRRLGEFPMGK